MITSYKIFNLKQVKIYLFKYFFLLTLQLALSINKNLKTFKLLFKILNYNNFKCN